MIHLLIHAPIQQMFPNFVTDRITLNLLFSPSSFHFLKDEWGLKQILPVSNEKFSLNLSILFSTNELKEKKQRDIWLFHFSFSLSISAPVSLLLSLPPLHSSHPYWSGPNASWLWEELYTGIITTSTWNKYYFFIVF